MELGWEEGGEGSMMSDFIFTSIPLFGVGAPGWDAPCPYHPSTYENIIQALSCGNTPIKMSNPYKLIRA